MSRINFVPGWKEELIASSEEGILVFEFTIAREHVYFPDEDLWKTGAPEWPKDKWELYRKKCEQWCSQNNIPFSLASGTFFYERNLE